MKFENLTEENYLQYAVSSYTNIRCHGIEEFYEDLLILKYIKKLFRKYKETGVFEAPRLRLALNHIIIFYNVFKPESATRILFFKLEPELHSTLKTFLVFLNLMPAIVHGINGKDILNAKLKTLNIILKDLETV